ncbi:MAG: hypothetical protein V3T25_07245 [Gemmatimonadota bacterium]
MVAEPEERSRSHGGGRFGCLLGLALLVASFYIATLFIRAEMRYRSVSERIQEKASQLSVDDRSEARERLAPVIRELGLPPGAERFEVSPAPGGARRFRLKVKYADTLHVLNWQKIIPRTIEAETS